MNELYIQEQYFVERWRQCSKPALPQNIVSLVKFIDYSTQMQYALQRLIAFYKRKLISLVVDLAIIAITIKSKLDFNKFPLDIFRLIL